MKINKGAYKRAVLVYQAGIANVFAVKCFNTSPFGRDAKRLMQADFMACENYARGLRDAGMTVKVQACNQAGDITNAVWTTDLETQPFSDKFCRFDAIGEIV